MRANTQHSVTIGWGSSTGYTKARDILYTLKPFVPRPLQIYVRRWLVRWKRRSHKNVWPIDPASGRKPEGWCGWPENRRFALVLSHDVDTARGQQNCLDLMNLEEECGFRSSFNFVPRRYTVSPELRSLLTEHGFEVGVHGLYHDGKLYSSKEVFLERALHINRYLKEWGAAGFRSPSMHHNLEWLKTLDIEYDASTFDTDPFEPQPDGVGVIFPFWVADHQSGKGYVELPYTLPQDFTLFILMGETSIDIWKKKLEWIAANGGMALVNTHPDYMNFTPRRPSLEQYPSSRYRELLEFIRTTYDGAYWHALPKEVARFWVSTMVDKTGRTIQKHLA